MDKIKIVSFDVEGTLVTTDYSYTIWFETIPSLYAATHNMDVALARSKVEDEYRKVGDQRLEWYDIRYWFDKFKLGAPFSAMEKARSRVSYYPETKEVLNALQGEYILTIASGSPHEFLEHLLMDIEPYFTRIFSSVSDYGQVKTEEFYRKMVAELDAKPEQIVHIGDNRQFDFLAPSALGIKSYYLERQVPAKFADSLNNLRQLVDLLRS